MAWRIALDLPPPGGRPDDGIYSDYSDLLAAGSQANQPTIFRCSRDFASGQKVISSVRAACQFEDEIGVASTDDTKTIPRRE